MGAVTARLISRSIRGGPVSAAKAGTTVNRRDGDFEPNAAEPAGERSLSDRAAFNDAPASIEQRVATCSGRRTQRQLRAQCFGYAKKAPKRRCSSALPAGER